MLDKVKGALRLKTAAFDAEIKGLIAAAYADLRLAGVELPMDRTAGGRRRKRLPAVDPTIDPGNPLIERAVILYCKANYGFIEDAERFQRAYDALKCSLSLAGDYHA